MKFQTIKSALICIASVYSLSAQADIKSEQRKRDSLAKEVKSQADKNSRLDKEVKDLQRNNDILRAEIKSLESKNQDLEKRKAHEQETLSDSKAANKEISEVLLLLKEEL